MCSEFGAHRDVEEAGVAGAEPMRGREGGRVAVRGSWGQITGDVGTLALLGGMRATGRS